MIRVSYADGSGNSSSSWRDKSELEARRIGTAQLIFIKLSVP